MEINNNIKCSEEMYNSIEKKGGRKEVIDLTLLE